VGPEFLFRRTAIDVFPAISEMLFEVTRETDVRKNGGPVDWIEEIGGKGFGTAVFWDVFGW
jgi:hypothetical protein